MRRRVEGGDTEVAATLPAGSESFVDTVPLDALDVTYTIRTLRNSATSVDSAPFTALNCGNRTMFVRRGRARDRSALARDTFKAKGILDGLVDFSPSTDALRIVMGAANNPIVMSIPAGDPGWKIVRNKYVWDSKNSPTFPPRIRLVLHVGRDKFKIKAKKLDWPGPQDPRSVGLGIEIGDQRASDQDPWRQNRRRTKLRYPAR